MPVMSQISKNNISTVFEILYSAVIRTFHITSRADYRYIRKRAVAILPVNAPDYLFIREIVSQGGHDLIIYTAVIQNQPFAFKEHRKDFSYKCRTFVAYIRVLINNLRILSGNTLTEQIEFTVELSRGIGIIKLFDALR